MKNYDEFVAIKEMTVNDAVVELIDFCSENDIFEYVENFIYTDEVNNMVKSRLDSGDWRGVACLLTDICTSLNEDYYFIDGYENLRRILKDDIDCIVSDITREHPELFEEEEEEEE